MSQTMSSREFNHDTAGAKRAAEAGPVFITDRGRPAHVLLTYEAFEQMLGPQRFLEQLGEPEGAEDIGLEPPTRRDVGRPATFD